MAKAKLDDKQRKMLLADRIDGASLRELAEKYDVSTTTVRRVIASDENVSQIVTQKKEQNTQEVLEYMETKKQIVCNIIDLYLNELSDAERIKQSATRELATTLGIIIDKFTGISKEQSETPAGGVIEIPYVGAEENNGERENDE